MLGKRMHHNSKGRLANKDNGKPSSPGITPYTKPTKIPGSVSTAKIKVETCPIPYIKIQDNAVLLPRFTAVAARSADEPIGMDELDGLQLELESLLCNTALRCRYFQSEIESIDSNESKREKKGKAAGKQLQYPVKRKFQDDKVVKTKDYTKLSNQPKVPKFKNFSNASSGSHTYSNDLVNSDNSVKLELSQLALPKNNIPYKFWNSVEPYCAPVTLDDIKFLESLLAQSSNTTLPPIPPLGKHYSEVWADEHLAEDQNASNPNKQKSSMSPDASHARKKLEKSSESMITGPLTQRLVSALMEENVMSYEIPDIKVKMVSTTKSGYKNSLTLEKCLRKELVEQGILDPEDLPPLTNPADDEILAEIKKCQTELTAVRKENCRNLKNLIGLCKQEMIRLNLKKQLDQVDLECIDIYKKMVAAKQKKRPVTKKEKEDAWKAINEQIRLNKEINALPQTGPNSN
ncbi:transcriptional adapter 3 [Bombyx mandarina]|uniref:Transcriptional adaptor 3 n=2 Tax=Bombyx TaxID=7090 RepID=Q1HQA8_BOMMO|nr:transcriptional adaptor 3 [Bombyx mori]XP_028041710.1 transcriptional adapter 3 [Bombyx mandarina]ABF51233.1 transcriptional adaptor 3 [Bombyx mori]